jgi:hypothetical protein
MSGFAETGDQSLPLLEMPKGKPIESKKGQKMTEAEFKKALYQIFKNSDENQSYRIDKGKEFDNFLV